MDFTFRFSQTANAGSATIETAGSLASTNTSETAGSLAWVSGDSNNVDSFTSSNPFAPQVDYSQYSTPETAGSVAMGVEVGGSVAMGVEVGGSVASVGGDCGAGAAVGGGGDCGGGFSSFC